VERPEIVELHFSALTLAHDVEPLSPFLSQRVEWILSAADPQTSGDESLSNAIRFSDKDGLRELALYFPDRLNVISGDLTGCITHHHLVFAFGRVRLRPPGTRQVAETNIAAKLTFQGSKIIKCQIRISWPLAFES
jgi:hypothetical protein